VGGDTYCSFLPLLLPLLFIRDAFSEIPAPKEPELASVPLLERTEDMSSCTLLFTALLHRDASAQIRSQHSSNQGRTTR